MKKKIEAGLITVDKMSKLYNLSKPTINYYTGMGLLPVAEKHGNMRLYEKTIIDKRLLKIKEMRRAGYSLMLIRQQLGL